MNPTEFSAATQTPPFRQGLLVSQGFGGAAK